jgi:hypothetical protein
VERSERARSRCSRRRPLAAHRPRRTRTCRADKARAGGALERRRVGSRREAATRRGVSGGRARLRHCCLLLLAHSVIAVSFLVRTNGGCSAAGAACACRSTSDVDYLISVILHFDVLPNIIRNVGFATSRYDVIATHNSSCGIADSLQRLFGYFSFGLFRFFKLIIVFVFVISLEGIVDSGLV